MDSFTELALALINLLFVLIVLCLVLTGFLRVLGWCADVIARLVERHRNG